MECVKIKKILPEYSVGGLSEKKREFVKRHIESCPDCSRELMLLDKTASLLDSIPQEEPPEFLWEGVRREIIRQERPLETPVWQKFIGWFWGRRIPALATGLAVLILVTGLYFALWKSPTASESTLYAETQQQTFSYWNTSFADRAALGMFVIKTGLEGENNETFR